MTIKQANRVLIERGFDDGAGYVEWHVGLVRVVQQVVADDEGITSFVTLGDHDRNDDSRDHDIHRRDHATEAAARAYVERIMPAILERTKRAVETMIAEVE